ncbi:MAG: DMT family transporter [Clostridia bacterium]|nr:DMT family transporter [Clostridia bacterium]
MNRKTRSPLGILCLLLAAMIWGFAFPAQSAVSEGLAPFTVNTVRSFMAGVFLIPCILLFDRSGNRCPQGAKTGFSRVLTPAERLGGVLCGVILFISMFLQQFGISGEETDSGKAAFITALYVVIVPILGLFRGKKPEKRVWFCVGLSLVGFYLLTAVIKIERPGIGGFLSGVFGGFHPVLSDLAVLLCALTFSFHVIAIDEFTPRVSGMRLSCVQFFTVGCLSAPFMLIREKPSFAVILSYILPLLYLGVCSGGIAYTLQIIGQSMVDVSVAPLILSLESVFGALGGAIFLGETKTPLQIVGCVLVFLSVYLSEIQIGKKPPHSSSVSRKRESKS